MKLLFISILLLTLLCCCKKNKTIEYQPVQIPCALTKNMDTAKLYIQGTWLWLEEKRMSQSQGQLMYLTPQNQGYTLSMKLSNDTARFFRNNQPDSVYTFKIQRLAEISGTNFPEDQDPVLVFYRLTNNLRAWHVPFIICPDYLQLQYQYVRSIEGEQIWKKQ